MELPEDEAIPFVPTIPQQQPQLRQLEQQQQQLQDPRLIEEAARREFAAALEWVKAYEPDRLW